VHRPQFQDHLILGSQIEFYDQHVQRAMRFIQAGRIEEIPATDPEKIKVYVDQYVPFHAQFERADSREVDKALWAFGKFLSEDEFPLAPTCGISTIIGVYFLLGPSSYGRACVPFVALTAASLR
jgi:hypothetical protein